MAMGLEEFVGYTGAELVAGNIIVGVTSERRIVGSTVDGAFTLNAAGQALLAELESDVPAIPGMTAEPAVEVASQPEPEPVAEVAAEPVVDAAPAGV